MKYYDISPTISSRTAVFPGDQSFKRHVSMDFPKGDHLGLSSIVTSVHIGAHTDAPCHYGANQDSIEQRSLHYYFGLAQVISVKSRPERILPEHITTPILAPRLLFSTDSYPDPEQWTENFTALSPELIHWAHKQGVILFGIDTPSVDPAQSKALESHQALLATDSAVLEGIVLSAVPDGVYVLSSLPLKMSEADASPVRAVLWEKEELLKWL